MPTPSGCTQATTGSVCKVAAVLGIHVVRRPGWMEVNRDIEVLRLLPEHFVFGSIVIFAMDMIVDHGTHKTELLNRPLKFRCAGFPLGHGEGSKPCESIWILFLL